MTGKSRSKAPRKLTLSQLEAFLGASPDDAPEVHAYCDSAAVLVAFDVLSLRPLDGSGAPAEGEVLDALLTVCEPSVHATQPGLWSLTLPARHAALARLKTRSRMKAARAANPGPSDLTLQKMLDRVIAGAAFDVQKLSRDEIAALLTISEWMDGIPIDLPDKRALRHALARSDLLVPLHRLAGTIFVGREPQLKRLAEYTSSPVSLPPLFVFGTGGVGKSALLARCVLRDLVPRGQPVAYLDIDRPTIQPEKPLTLLVDAITQFAPQIGWTAQDVDPMLNEITNWLRRQEGGRQLESIVDDDWVFSLFGDRLVPLLAGRIPVLVVDTIEEAQFLGSEVVWGLMSFLFNLVRRIPAMRVVLAGRVLPDEYVALAKSQPTGTFDNVDGWMRDEKRPERPINLGVLDEPSARELLTRELELLQVPPLTDAELTDVIGIVTSNPMCLKLSARVLRDEGVGKLRADRAQFLAKLKAEKIQGLLYGRILRHLHGTGTTGHEDVRSVAYPGLVVRRLTADVIREVLAVPCKLTLTREQNEVDIFNALSREAALMEFDPQDNSLRHRADVRRVMLQDLTDHIDAGVVNQIDLNAVEYYTGKLDTSSRAEEIYHRMRRAEPPEALEPLWRDDVASRLKGAIEEVSGRQRLWLASKLRVTLDNASRESADQDAWEEQTARLVDRYLKSRAADKALDALKERPARAPRSRLYALETEAYRFLGRFDEALAVARKGVDALSVAGATDMALELQLRMAAIEESRGRLPAADHLIDEALGVARHSGNRLLKLRTNVAMLRLQRQLRPGGRQERKVLRRGVLDELTDEVRQELRASPVLLREVTAEVGKDDPSLTALAIDTLGMEVANDDQARALGHAIVTIDESQGAPETTRIISEGASKFKKADFDPTVIRKWVVENVTARDTRRLSQSVNAGSDDVLRGFRDYFRAGVQSTLRGDY